MDNVSELLLYWLDFGVPATVHVFGLPTILKGICLHFQFTFKG